MRIIIAEDQAVERRILEAGLRKAGFEVDAYPDGRAAWERFEHEPARLVVSDWMMPRMDGLELIRRIRGADLARHTYTILLTARAEKNDVVSGLAAGVDDYVTKPVDHRELAARVAIGRRMIRLEDRLVATQERLERLATYDGLTGLLNRQAVVERAETELARARRNQTSVGAIMIDVDHFKRVNDTGGHSQGDRVLRAIAQLLTDQVRPYDLVGRWGGEEFLVVLPDAWPQDAQLVAERVRRAVAESEIGLDGGESIRVQVSAGVASCVPDGSTIDSLIKLADDALYEAKRHGRNQVVMAASSDIVERSA